jgi:kumamolisin
MAVTHVPLPGSRRPPPHDSVRLRSIDPHTHVEVTVTLTGPELPGLNEIPKEALSAADIAKKWGVPANNVQRVESVLRSFGLQVLDVRQGGRSIRVAGSAAAMEAAFHANLGIYKVPDQGEIRGREGALSVPAELEGLISGVDGLDQRQMAKRHGAPAPAASPALAPQSPIDLIARYEFPDGDGAGRTIAIAEFANPLGNGSVLPPAYIPTDVSSFCAKYNIPPPTPRVVPVGVAPLNQQQFLTYMQQVPTQLKKALFGATAETMMDVQIVASLSPGADIAVYFATWDQKGWIDLLDDLTSPKAGAPPKPVAVSISYGLAEEAPDWTKGAMTSINHRLQIAMMLGITVCVSAGDDGSGCDQPGSRCHVEFPASSPFVLSVGGTQLNLNGGNVDEVVWWVSPGQRTVPGAGATGGGVSVLNPRAPWQTVQVTSLNPTSIDGRVVPDVSALAGSPLYDLLLNGQPFPDGGTSAATPLWAALIARIDAALPAGKQQRFLPRLIYQAGAQPGFRDITSGNNASYPNPGVGYAADVGYDAVSGLGVPQGKALLAALTNLQVV